MWSISSMIQLNQEVVHNHLSRWIYKEVGLDLSLLVLTHRYVASAHPACSFMVWCISTTPRPIQVSSYPAPQSVPGVEPTKMWVSFEDTDVDMGIFLRRRYIYTNFYGTYKWWCQVQAPLGVYATKPGVSDVDTRENGSSKEQLLANVRKLVKEICT